MKECCIQGVKHEGEATGTIKEVGGIKSYVSTPSKSNGKAILFLPDAFGLALINNKLLSDDFAKQGYTSVIPDVFRGNDVPANAMSTGKFDLPGWLANHPKEVIEPIILKAIEGIKNELGLKKIGAVGYCFGGRYVIRLLADGSIDAGFTAHPSFAEDDEIAAVKGPLSLALSESDHFFTPEKKTSTEAALAKGKSPYQITIYGGTGHGFGIRGDMSDPKQKFAKEAAFHQASMWFAEYL